MAGLGALQAGAGSGSEGEGELRCGWGPFRPKCLQRLRTAKWALFWLCCAGAIQGMVVNGFVNVVITTIERRFGLRSSQSGLIAGGYDVASFLCLAPVTYLGGRARASKPRWLGWGSLLMGAGSLLFALPHFVVSPYRAVEDALVRDTCDNSTINVSDSCSLASGAGEAGGSGALWVFLVAQLLHGAGAAPLFTLGVTYIDENVSKKMSSVYLALERPLLDITSPKNTTTNGPATTARNGGATRKGVPCFLCYAILGGFATIITAFGRRIGDRSNGVECLGGCCCPSPGIYYTMAVVGPAVGYVLGGQLLTLYTDFLSVDPSEVGLSASSPAWVGAWWVGFVLAALLCVVVAVPILAFPYELPGAAELAAERVSEAHGASNVGGVGIVGDAKESAGDALRGLPHACGELLRNPAFLFLNLAGASEGMLISGFAAFLPKLIENQFSVNASSAALLLGVITVPAGGGGTFLGGWLVKRWQLSCAGIVRLCVAATLCATAFTFCFVLSCPNLPFAGVTASYGGAPAIVPHTRSTWSRLEGACNAGCGCARATWSPVCGADGVAYYSPCHAGCKTRLTADVGDELRYDDCACVAASTLNLEPIHTGSKEDQRGNTTSGVRSGNENQDYANIATAASVVLPQLPPHSAINRPCASLCPYLWLFVFLAFGIMFFTFLATMPALSATLRCVRDDQRSFALGIQWIKVRLLGTIPAPMIFGALIDETCLLWQKSCDGRGACLVYDNLYMSRYMLALAFIGKGCSLLFFFLAWWYYVPPQSTKSANPAPEDLKANVESNDISSRTSNGYCNTAIEHDRF